MPASPREGLPPTRSHHPGSRAQRHPGHPPTHPYSLTHPPPGRTARRVRDGALVNWDVDVAHVNLASDKACKNCPASKNKQSRPAWCADEPVVIVVNLPGTQRDRCVITNRPKNRPSYVLDRDGAAAEAVATRAATDGAPCRGERTRRKQLPRLGGGAFPVCLSTSNAWPLTLVATAISNCRPSRVQVSSQQRRSRVRTALASLAATNRVLQRYSRLATARDVETLTIDAFRN